MLTNHGIEQILEWGKKGHLDGSAIYPSVHKRYIAYAYPKFRDCKGGHSPRRTFSFKI